MSFKRKYPVFLITPNRASLFPLPNLVPVLIRHNLFLVISPHFSEVNCLCIPRIRRYRRLVQHETRIERRGRGGGGEGGVNGFNIAVRQNRTDNEANVEAVFPGL